ncbi:neuroendocrine convertase 1-like [Neocloeon triangulifer]|uniref:neuroendocrine convertase 1-like n=1 Tax=Neocloeon triangulifer TaxID=2078957 RepID=UPI00286F02FE|nr:neuroendocrine convertase 1-like [Neocloeon triangulifer]
MAASRLACLVLFSSASLSVINCDGPHIFSNHFVAEIEGGDEQARKMAFHYDLRLMNTDLFPNFYHFVDHKQPKFNRLPSWRTTRNLRSHHKVKYVEQQVFRHRSLRRLEIMPFEDLYFSDPYYERLWYLHGRGLHKDGKIAQNINVEPVWEKGITGHGVTLFVLDDGLQARNKEIAQNYEKTNSWDVSDINHPMPSPAPRNPSDSHGTFCAGALAAVANNSVCGAGVAFGARVGGIRVLGKRVLTDVQESLALRLWLGNGDIASASWGPRDNGKTVEGPKRLARKALRDAVIKGRRGKGAIFVWAAGNGAISKDNANLDGYASSIYTITIGALSYNGDACVYSEPGASVMTSIAVSGKGMGFIGVSVVVPNLDGTCKQDFQGTSAAAPIAAGIVALMLEENPDLTWRDVQHLIVLSAQRSGTRSDWRKNGAGLEYNLRQGFGAMDATKLVTSARNWKNVGQQEIETASFGKLYLPVVFHPLSNKTFEIEVARSSKINRLEHVILFLTVQHGDRGTLEIFLTSPSGTDSQLLTRRKYDKSDKGFSNWPFMSVHFWNENPAGTWKVTMSNFGGGSGQVLSANLILYGHWVESDH